MALVERLLERFGLVRLASASALQTEVSNLSKRVKMLKTQASGVDLTWGRFDYEAVSALQVPNRWDTLDKMENDAHIKGALQSAAMPLLQAEWTVAPASGDAKDIEIAEFVSANLLRDGGDTYGKDYWCQSSWRAQRLPEILDMLKSGYAMFAKSYREVEGKVVYDRIQWLEPRSVDPHGWVLDETDNLQTVKRTLRKPSGDYLIQEPLPAAQIALYVWDMKGARFEGRPFVRSMYGPWYRKDFLQRMAMIWAQKVGAPPPYGLYPNTWSNDQVTEFQAYIKSLRGTAAVYAYGTFARGSDEQVEVGYAGSEVGDVDRMRTLIDGENAELSHAGASKSQLLGETQTGSRAVAEPMSRNEFLVTQAIAEVICEWENHGVGNLTGLVEELVNLNFAGVRAYPKLVCSKVSPLEGLETLDGLLKAKAAGLVPSDPQLARQVVERLGYEVSDDAIDQMEADQQAERDAAVAQEDAKQQLAKQGETPAEPSDEPAEGEEDVARAAAEQVALAVADFRARIAPLLQPASTPGQGTRPQTLLEAKVCNLAAVSETYRVGERDVLATLRKIRVAMTEDLVNRAKAGVINERTLGSQRRSKFRGEKRAKSLLKPELKGIAEKGRRHVQEEIAKQRGR